MRYLAGKFGFSYHTIELATYYDAVRMVCKSTFVNLLIHKYHFQSTNRDADLMLTQSVYRIGISQNNDYLRPVGVYNFRFMSATPETTQNYLTLISPFDGYIWAFLLFSLVAVTITLIIIDTMYATWTNTSKKDIIYQSKYNTTQFCYLNNKILLFRHPYLCGINNRGPNKRIFSETAMCKGTGVTCVEVGYDRVPTHYWLQGDTS